MARSRRKRGGKNTGGILLDRDEDRTVSPGLMESLERASRYSEPILLDCSAAADIYGELLRLRRLTSTQQGTQHGTITA